MYLFCPKCGQYQKINTIKITTISDGTRLTLIYHSKCWLCNNMNFEVTIRAPKYSGEDMSIQSEPQPCN